MSLIVMLKPCQQEDVFYEANHQMLKYSCDNNFLTHMIANQSFYFINFFNFIF